MPVLGGAGEACLLFFHGVYKHLQQINVFQKMSVQERTHSKRAIQKDPKHESKIGANTKPKRSRKTDPKHDEFYDLFFGGIAPSGAKTLCPGESRQVQRGPPEGRGKAIRSFKL